MSTTRLRHRRIAFLSLGLITLATPFLLSGTAFGHGYSQQPPSRSYLCSEGKVKDCGDIQWEPQSVEGPKGFPDAGPADGQLCSGGNGRFTQLDDPRGGKWPATKVTSGATYDFVWHLTARHATTSIDYYITTPNADLTKPLTRNSLDLTPFLSKDYDGMQPPANVSDSGTLPADRHGRAVILSVWTIADTGNAFYQCADVDFG